MITKEKYGRIGDFSFVIMLSVAAEVLPGLAAVDSGSRLSPGFARLG
jgi:hypothetical protein